MGSRKAVAALTAVALATGVSACGGVGSAKTAHDLSTNPQVQQDVQKAKAKINQCGGVLKLVNKSTRNQVISCLAPPSKQAQLKQCISTAASKNHLWRKAGREQFVVDSAGCIVR